MRQRMRGEKGNLSAAAAPRTVPWSFNTPPVWRKISPPNTHPGPLYKTPQLVHGGVERAASPKHGRTACGRAMPFASGRGHEALCDKLKIRAYCARIESACAL